MFTVLKNQFYMSSMSFYDIWVLYNLDTLLQSRVDWETIANSILGMLLPGTRKLHWQQILIMLQAKKIASGWVRSRKDLPLLAYNTY